ncbi:hypothetical protein KIN20_022495 [Parelaphostrongylus tenuis]|uniref:Uncharacterized protein n=1 Tax=Parelaphostrongylus tenuis TaxID=148309 RepID=A0AAD5MQE2_PARTN|nr:hypothetical protein KIN20_022495 [Parelaphostrongylus tenuis]
MQFLVVILTMCQGTDTHEEPEAQRGCGVAPDSKASYSNVGDQGLDSCDWEDSPGEGKWMNITHYSSTPAWKIPWMEEGAC